jgi:hypothetical protein
MDAMKYNHTPQLSGVRRFVPSYRYPRFLAIVRLSIAFLVVTAAGALFTAHLYNWGGLALGGAALLFAVGYWNLSVARRYARRARLTASPSR